jgi:hypothetical protein
MAKQHKYNLVVESETDYDLIGICSHHSDYRLVWGINELLKLKLVKSNEDFMVYSKKGGTNSHSFYAQLDPEFEMDYYLIKNKCNGKFLIPEKQQIDYFLFLLNNQTVHVTEWIEKLKNHPSVLTAFQFDPLDFPSADNIIFN